MAMGFTQYSLNSETSLWTSSSCSIVVSSHWFTEPGYQRSYESFRLGGGSDTDPSPTSLITLERVRWLAQDGLRFLWCRCCLNLCKVVVA